MEFPEEKYYRLNYILLSSIGLWPYDNSSIKQIQVILSLLIYISFFTVQFMKLFVPEYSLDLLLEVLAINFLFFIWFIKYVAFSSVMENIKQLRNCVRSNWSILVDDREIDILHKYAKIGKQSTIAIASNGTTGVAAETFLLVNSLHAFGMFKIASYRMERMLSIDVSQIPIAKSYIIFHDKITAAVDIHRRAIEFSDLLKARFGLSYLFMIIAAICSATVSLFRLFRIMTMQQEKMEIVKLLCYVVFLFLFLIIGNFVGQEFINRDNHVHRTICNTKWYNAPLKIQKFVLFLIRKTTKSYKVDAAGLFSPSLEGLATAMSLLLSFLTLLCSI
ncbi:uncharacterized protein [Temnothorax nylanderi]|uniref:uncharacterized protein n=1 Tax=Temnothorax nylanderi TaxID=102681 RepID=UPI003A87FC06